MYKHFFLCLIFSLALKNIFGQTTTISSSVNILNYSNNNMDLQIITTFDFGSGSNCPKYHSNNQTKFGDTLKIKYLYNCAGPYPLFTCTQIDTLYINNVDTNINIIQFVPCCYNPNNNDTNESVFENIIPIYPTYIKSVFESNTIKIYPNPANDILYILPQNNTEIKSIKIYNFLGILVYNQYYSNSPLQISYVTKGLYIVRCETNKGILSTKFIKE
jgi:hypothetical protein